MSNYVGFLRKKKVLFLVLLLYGFFLIVVNVIYRKVFFFRKGEGLMFICCFCCCKFNFIFKINKIFIFLELRFFFLLWGCWKFYLILEFNKCYWWGSIYDLDKGIEKLEVFFMILGYYNDFFYVWRSYDRLIGWLNLLWDNSILCLVFSLLNFYGVVFL